MRTIPWVRLAWVLVLVLGLAAPLARADLYSAQAAYAKEDFTAAFDLYRELAELGDVRGQEYLAAMYVNGEGVKRDNVLGYGWAAIAKENGGGEVAQTIVAQLEPHVTPKALEKVAALQSQFGKDAIAKRWLPVPLARTPAAPCKFKVPANPDFYYPQEAIKRGFSGDIVVGFTVGADGRAHDIHVWVATPKDMFDGAARAVVMASTFEPLKENGFVVPCSMRIKVKFIMHGPGDGDEEIRKSFEQVKPNALAGDPVSQTIYGILLATRSDLNKEGENFIPWITRAAQAGVPAAQYMLGLCIFDGYAAEHEPTKGLAWLTKASANGNADAQAALANYLLRTGVPGDAARARQWLEKSAAAGNREGTYALAAVLATNPDPALRDPKRALTVVELLRPDLDALPTAIEIRAAARAFSGNFAAAQGDQRRAIRKAKTLGWDLVPLQKRLDAYLAQQTWSGDLSAL